MKRIRLKPLFGGSAAVVFSIAGIVAPGCESLVRDPQAFLADSPCNIFNCDTLAFLNGDSIRSPKERSALEPGITDGESQKVGSGGTRAAK